MDSERLFDLYNQYFMTIKADTPELLEEVYRLRYQVYCVEHNFEKPGEFPDGLERDEFDSHSVHSLLIHKPSQLIAGSARLVLPVSNNLTGCLPIDRVCKDRILQHSDTIPRRYAAEVSRFAFVKQFRRRIGEQGSPCGVTDESLQALETAQALSKDRRIAHHLTLGMISSLVKMSLEHNVNVWCSVMERALLRLLTRIGIHFTNIGPQISYHGRRQPCYTHVGIMLERVKEERPDVWEVLTEEGEFQFSRETNQRGAA